MPHARFIHGAALVLAALTVAQLGSQSSSPTVTIASLPAWGQDGMVSGYVYGLPADQMALYLFEFIPDVGWVSLPSCGQVQIQSTGQFSIDAAPNLIYRNATRFSAYLIPASLSSSIPCVGGASAIPFIVVHNALSSVTYPRLANYTTLSFGGLDWFVKTAPVQVSPYNQFFTTDTAFVDSLGQLHLKVEQCSGSWCAAEIFTKQAIGYGTYTFTIASPVNNLDPNLTLGLFTWDGEAADQANREWDIEFSRWGNAGAPYNAQYVVQPYNASPNNLMHFLMSPASTSTHVVTWNQSQVNFASSSAGLPISSWTYTSGASPVPTPGEVHLHINLYIGAGTAPVSPVGTEIVISNFQYTPSSSQIGFSGVGASAPFYSTSGTVQTTGLPGCSATAQSDSPWISIVGSSPVAAGGLLGYTVADNYGTARSGNIILRSTTCNPMLGSQVFSISQDGLVCSPAFAAPSTSVGFIQSMRSVLVRGSAPVCTWSISSSAPWLQITSSASGTGDGSVTFATDTNTGSALRQGSLVLNNGQQHSVYQDAAEGYFSLSPSAATPCNSQQAQFGVSWASASPNVEIHLVSPGGSLIGQFGASGTTLLPPVSDGTQVFLVQPSTTGGEPTVLASAVTSVLPTNCTAANINPLGIVNAAGYSAISVAPGSFVTLFGSNLASQTARPTGVPYPTNLGGVSVSIAGEQCGLTYVSPGQINFVMPSDVTPGRYVLTAGSVATEVIVTNVSPGIFTLTGDGKGVPLAQIIEAFSDGTSVTLPPYQCSQTCGISPISLPGNLTDLYIVIYGTGFRNLHSATASLGPLATDVIYAGAVAQYPGLDQMNLHIKNPTGLSGLQNLQITVDGTPSNVVNLQFQ